MKKMETTQTDIDVMVCKATLTIMDRRNGKMGDKVFYRFGYRFPYKEVSAELAVYGYNVIGYKDEQRVAGVVDLAQMYNALEAMQTEAA